MAMLNDPVNGSSSDALSVLALLLGMLLFLPSTSTCWWPASAGQLRCLAGGPEPEPAAAADRGLQHGLGVCRRLSAGHAHHLCRHAGAAGLWLHGPHLAQPQHLCAGLFVVTLFGLAMLAFMLRHIPAHYLQMTRRALDMLTLMMKA
jgi:flagellar biosynthetic protein FliR